MLFLSLLCPTATTHRIVQEILKPQMAIPQLKNPSNSLINQPKGILVGIPLPSQDSAKYKE